MKKSIFLFFAAILCAMTANAYNQSAVDLYFDNSEAKWSSCYVYIGHTTHTCCYPMTRVSGTQYLWKLAKADFNGGGSWGGASGWVVCKEKWWDKADESIYKYTWHGTKNVTNIRTSAWSASYIYKTNGTTSVTSDGNTIDAYNTTTYSKNDYTVTINTVEGGTLTVNDYDDNAVANGASKIHLTVLKFSAAPASGYVLEGVQINDGSTTTTISASEINTKTHTLTSNVTITPVWKATTSTVIVTTSATNGTVTGGGVVEEGTSVTLTATADAGYQFKNWTVAGAEVSTANPYIFTVDADITVTANFEELPKVTVYAINSVNWDAIAVHHWPKVGAGTSWPGDLMTNTGEKAPNGFDVYTATFLAEHENCIFNNNGNGKQTGDLTVKDGQYYDLKSETWYASLAEVPAPDPLATDVFLAGSMNEWSTTANEFKKVEEGSATATLTMNLEAETVYEFKVVREGAWTSRKDQDDDMTITETIEGLQFSSSSSKNCKMKTNLAGPYIFTWEISTSKLSITYPASTEPDPTPEPEPVADVTIYFVNTKSWSTVNAYVWGSAEYKGWPGEAMTPTGENAHGYDVYSYTFPAEYTNCIFNGNGKTDDLTVNAGQYFDIASKTWYATLADVPNPAPAVMETVYFINTGNWGKVNAYAWTSSGDNEWPGAEMTPEAEQIAGVDVYSFTAEQGQWANLIFNNGEGTQTGDLKWEAGKYYMYSKNAWYDTKEDAEDALAGPATIVLHGNFLGGWADTEAFTLSADQKTATLTTLVKAGDHEFGVRLNNVWTANGKAFTKTDNEHVIEAGSSNLTLNAEITGDYVFTWTYETNTLTVTYPTEEVVVEEHYYLIGTFNTWTQKDANYELTLDGTVYKKEVTFAKDVEFKINVGDWSSSWGKDNLGGKTYAELDGTNDGNLKMKEEKTFTVIFDPANNGTISFDGLTEKAPTTISYVLMGVNGDWTNGIPMTVNPDNENEYVLTDQVIIKATDSIKVVTLTDGQATAWCGKVDSWSNATYTGGGEANIVLEDGIYTFYFKKNEDLIYINQTGYARNVTNTYGTICLPYASASTSGATFFEVVGKGTEDGKDAVYLASVTTLEAGVPYIFEKSASANQIKVVYTGDKVNAPVNTDANGLIGNFTNETVVPAGNYILYNDAFIPADGTTNKVNAYRAYLDLSDVDGGKPQPMPGRRYIGMSVQGENGATGVEDLFTTDAPVKVIENGQLIIIRDGVKYNVQGQKL